MKTFGELLFAISGAVLKFSIDRPLQNAAHDAPQTKVIIAKSSTEDTVRVEQPPQGVFRTSTETTNKVAA
jgi:hypothetical protein